MSISNAPKDVLEQELAALRGREYAIKEELKRRKNSDKKHLAEWMKDNSTMFILFFKVGGCKRPEEALRAFLDNYETKRPVAYVQDECEGGE
jgi:hypothetical protein